MRPMNALVMALLLALAGCQSPYITRGTTAWPSNSTLRAMGVKRVQISTANQNEIPFIAPAKTIMGSERMPYTAWYVDAKLNYAQALLYPPVEPSNAAIIAICEDGKRKELSTIELRFEVARCQAALINAGVEAGDRVAAFVRNTPEANAQGNSRRIVERELRSGRIDRLSRLP